MSKFITGCIVVLQVDCKFVNYFCLDFVEAKLTLRFCAIKNLKKLYY